VDFMKEDDDDEGYYWTEGLCRGSTFILHLQGRRFVPGQPGMLFVLAHLKAPTQQRINQ
jgi:hypothetical protein